jgi:putative membrane protein
MMKMLLSWLIMSVAVWVTATVVPGIKVRSFGAAVVVAAVYGVLNVFLGRLLFFLTFPLAVITLGVIVNAILLWITDKLLDEFEIDGIVPLTIGAVVLGVTNWGLRAIFF